MSEASRHLGLDLGGTNIKVAVIEPATTGLQVVATASEPTEADLGPAGVSDRLIETGRSAIEQHRPIVSVGVGVPGVFDATGHIVLFPNLPGPWPGYDLVSPLRAAWGLPVTLINDARAFTLAEGRVGAGRGCDTVVAVTLGTGIGGGVMIGGRLVLGAAGRAGEIGHQTVLPDGPRCGCGNLGCAEALARADVIALRAGKPTVEAVYAGVTAGDERCIEAVSTAATHLGIAIANMVTVLGPDRVVVGGGIVSAGDAVLDPIRRAVVARAPLVPPASVSIVAAELGPSAGAIGAAIAGMDAAASALS